jgi:hypothetical protein
MIYLPTWKFLRALTRENKRKPIAGGMPGVIAHAARQNLSRVRLHVAPPRGRIHSQPAYAVAD